MPSNKKINKKAIVDTNRCAACGVCLKNCPIKAITIKNGIYAEIDTSKCVGCGLCTKACPASIIDIQAQEVSHEKS